jgi:uncharacterized membrane protein
MPPTGLPEVSLEVLMLVHAFAPRPRRGTQLGSLAAALALLATLAVGAARPVSAAGGLELTTPFPSIAVQPGSTAKFTITLAASSAMTVALSVDGVPDGWTEGIHGGGLDVRSVYVPADGTAEVELDIAVPDDATEAETTLTVTGRAPGASASLTLIVNVAAAAGGTVELTTDIPTLQGASDANFNFTLTLHNATPQQLTFSLQAVGPSGWDVTAQPTGQQQAASFTVDAGASHSIDVKAVPPDGVEAGSFPIGVQAVASGGRTAEAQLTVQITGRVKMSLTTTDGRLNANATAGSSSDLTVVVSNDGTSPLGAVNLTATAPSGWEVTFEPATIDSVAANQTGTAVAHIKPSGDAVAGDYQITIKGANDQANASMDIRVTVEASALWGAVGIILILAAVGGLFWVFQRYGRR